MLRGLCQKSLSILLCLSILLGILCAGESFSFAASTSSGTLEGDAFSRQLSDLLRSNNEDYFGQITVDVQNNTIQRDEQEEISLGEYGIDYSYVTTPEPVVPVEAVLEAMGEQAAFDEQTAEVSVNGEKYCFTDRDLVEDGEIITNEGGVLTVESDSDVLELPAAYMNEEQAKGNFCLDFAYKDGKITVTAPYQSKRLIVQTKGALRGNFGAKKVLKRTDGYSVLQFATEQDTMRAKEKIEQQSGVQYVVCDTVVTVSSFLTERNGARQVQSDRYKEYLAEQGKITPITVAVVDTGVDTQHEMLQDRCVSGYNVYTKNSTAKDDHGHGTHCAGIVVDNTPDNVRIMPIKVLNSDGSGTSLSVAAGVDRAVESGADIISMSLGGLTDDMANDPMVLAVKRAYQAGVCVVCAAGNNYSDTKNYAPAGVKECITVASVETLGYSMSVFSNFGDSVDVAAPGENIMSSVPGNAYEKMSGTSMACPFVSAAAAMLLTNTSALTPAQVEQQIKNTATDMLTVGWDKYSGAGILNFGMLFGDENYPSDITLEDKEVHLTAFSKATGYFLKAGIHYDSANNRFLSDATFNVSTTNAAVADFEGRHIAPKGSGEATITLTTKTGKSCSVTVFCEKKEVWIDVAASSFAGGNGTKEHPYLIATAEQLSKLALDTRNGVPTNGKYYKLIKDIDLEGRDWISIVYQEETENMIGLGYAYTIHPFKGIFDGNNHKIKNMCVFSDALRYSWFDVRPLNYLWYKSNCGLFADIRSAIIKNLGVENATVYNSVSGILCSTVGTETGSATNIENVYTSGFSAGYGIFSSVLNSKNNFKNCFSSATVCRGGIGYGVDNPVYDGLRFENVFFCGTFAGADNAKSACGFLYTATGHEANKTTRFFNCFSTAVPESGIGFVKNATDVRFYKCYYASANRYGIQNRKGSDAPVAKDDSFFRTKANFTNVANWSTGVTWDFTNTWAINTNVNGGYPYLKNMKPDALKTVSTGTWIDYAANAFAGGNGTKDNPYRIESAEQLARLAKFYRFGGGKNQYFSLEKDIDLSAHDWFPIGGGPSIDKRGNIALQNEDDMTRHIFRGNINGNFHTISGLQIQSTGDYIGFISILDTGSVSNVNFENARVSGHLNVGIVCGQMSHCACLAGIGVSGSVTALEGVAGGVCGKTFMPSTVMGCEAKVCVVSRNLDGTYENYAGGIVGLNGGFVERCYTQNGTSVQGKTRGGITGKNQAVMQNCFTDSGYSLGDGIMYCCAQLVKDKYTLIAMDCKANNQKTVIPQNSITKEHLSSFDMEGVWQLSEKLLHLRPYGVYAYPENELPSTYWSRYKATSFAGGTGTYTDPYLIETPQQLALMAEDYAKSGDRAYKLISDIDLSAHLWDSEITGGLVRIYNIDFDGNHHTIKNVFFGDNGDGLFPIINTGNIFDFTIDTIKGTAGCGILGTLYPGGTISNCHVKNAVIINTVNYDSLAHPYNAAGICRANSGGTIDRCSFEGEVYGESGAAGICGDNRNAVVQNCYSIGTFLSSNAGNGIAHNTYSNSTIDYNYSFKLRYPRIETDYKHNIYAAQDFVATNIYGYQKEDLQKRETFDGWDFDEVWEMGGQSNNGFPIFKAMPKRSIAYETNGGTLPADALEQYTPYHAFDLPVPQKSGYRFDGWFYDEQLSQIAGTVEGRADKGNIRLYAKWTAVYYVKFAANGGKGSMKAQTLEVGKNTALNRCAFSRPGYVFQGWALSAGGKVVYKNAAGVKNIAALGKTRILYAVWKPIRYNVMFYNGYAGAKKRTVIQKNFVYDKSVKLRKNTFTYPGKGKYVLGGWQNTVTGKMYANMQSVKNLITKNNATVILKAYWVPDKVYTITYSLNGGTLPNNAKRSVRPGRGYYKLPNPSKKGYIFDGWYKNKTFTGAKVLYINPWIKGNTVLYAKWKRK